MIKLSHEQIQSRLADTLGWSYVEPNIQKLFQFETFKEAILFVNALAFAAEKMNHHPDVLIQYNKVTLSVHTHDASGITNKDFELAHIADSL